MLLVKRRLDPGVEEGAEGEARAKAEVGAKAEAEAKAGVDLRASAVARRWASRW